MLMHVVVVSLHNQGKFPQLVKVTIDMICIQHTTFVTLLRCTGNI